VLIPWHIRDLKKRVNIIPSDDDYPDESSRATCPECGNTIEFDNLVFDKKGTFILPE
jgi:hypothetical protein